MENLIKMDDLGVPLFSETPTLQISFPRKHEDDKPTTPLSVSELGEQEDWDFRKEFCGTNLHSLPSGKLT